MSLINCQKYPPSLLYLLITLGIAITLLPLLDKIKGRAAAFLSVYGRVPMFYYILHIYLLHLAALLCGLYLHFPLAMLCSAQLLLDPNTGWGFGLGWVYAVWISAVLLLYYPCRWYMRLKMKHKKWWMSYL
jgi:hypothetical protein